LQELLTELAQELRRLWPRDRIAPALRQAADIIDPQTSDQREETHLGGLDPREMPGAFRGGQLGSQQPGGPDHVICGGRGGGMATTGQWA
jgi:hypothetical protein